jgi:hypothetical protein
VNTISDLLGMIATEAAEDRDPQEVTETKDDPIQYSLELVIEPGPHYRWVD